MPRSTSATSAALKWRRAQRCCLFLCPEDLVVLESWYGGIESLSMSPSSQVSFDTSPKSWGCGPSTPERALSVNSSLEFRDKKRLRRGVKENETRENSLFLVINEIFGRMLATGRLES